MANTETYNLNLYFGKIMLEKNLEKINEVEIVYEIGELEVEINNLQNWLRILKNELKGRGYYDRKCFGFRLQDFEGVN